MTQMFSRAGFRLKTAAIVLGLGTLSSVAGPAMAKEPQSVIDQGRFVATGADCMACHTVPHSPKPYSGGYPIVSPLGTIYSTNITPSKTDGIGNYTEADFDRAVRKGIRRDGSHLYPAMPYDAYAEMTDSDLHALYAYFMQEVEPINEKAKDETALPFPFNIRLSMAIWNLIYATKSPFQPDLGVSDEVNRGAYLAGALGHCASCHTPRGLLMGADASGNLAGGFVGPWYAPNITSDPVSGIGGWRNNELVQYFRTGHADGKNQAAGGMAEAVQNSLQHLPDSDLQALAVYLKTVPAVRDPQDVRPAHEYGTAVSAESSIRGLDAPNAHDSLSNGERLYSGNCASCHQPNGSGSDNQSYPSLFHNTATGASQPANLVATILFGVEREAGGREVLMPGFGKQSYVDPLTDQEIVDVSNYVLTNFGNPSVKVSLVDVASARAGGPVPFLARLQPFILPLMALGIIFLFIFATWYGLRRRKLRTSP